MKAASLLRRFGAEAASVVAIVGIVVVPVWPGIFTVDSQAMYKMVQRGEVDDWYSPILVSCWRLLEWFGLPPATVLVGTTVVVVVALLAIYRLALPRRWALVATAATVVFAPVYGLLGWVGRDIWFLAMVLTMLASLGWASIRPRWARPLVSTALVTAWFAADARQNGFPVLAVAGGVGAWLLIREVRHRWLWVIGAGVLTVVVGLGLQRAAHVVTVQRDVSPEQVLYYQDVLAVSLRLDESQVPPSLLPRGQLDDVRRLWVSGQVGAVLFRDDPPVDYRPYAGSGKRTRVLRDAWIEMITDHPFDYAAERLDLARRLLGIGDAIPGAWYATSDDLDWEGSPELAQHFTNLNDLRGDYLRAFDSGVEGFGGGLHRAWIYLVLGLLSAGLIIALDPRLRVFGATLLALQIALQLVLVFAAPLGEYRFELFQIVLGIVAAVLAAVVAARARRGRDAITPSKSLTKSKEPEQGELPEEAPTARGVPSGAADRPPALTALRP